MSTVYIVPNGLPDQNSLMPFSAKSPFSSYSNPPSITNNNNSSSSSSNIGISNGNNAGIGTSVINNENILDNNINNNYNRQQPKPPQYTATFSRRYIPPAPKLLTASSLKAATVTKGGIKKGSNNSSRNSNYTAGQFTSTINGNATQFFVPQPPTTQKPSVATKSIQNSSVSVAPRRYNIEKLKLNSASEFQGFGSGIPDTLQSARVSTSSGKQNNQLPKQPLTARGALLSQKASRNSTPSVDQSDIKQWRFPNSVTPAFAIKMHSSQLTDYEQSEIFDYPRIFCIGNTKNKTKGSVSNNKCNHGYDDQRGDYQIVINDHIAYRYEIISMLGKGSFGQVCKCLDVKTNRFVALKIIRNKEKFHHQALVEVEILKHLRDNDPEKNYHIIEMYNSFYFRGHLCITFELLSLNLYEFIKNNNFQGLSLGLIRRFAVQILNSLKYLYREQIIHCDLKPENILLKSPNKSAIKMIDFGSSCFIENRMFTYIQSRFYRSPEVILGIPYGRGIDMWSFGCILAELYMGYPIFPGDSELDQMNYIMEIFDIPPRRIIEMSSRRKHFFDSYGNPRLVVCRRTQRKRKPGSRDLASVLRCKDRCFVNFLEGCLKWDPNERLTPDDALRHEWILDSFISNPVRELPPSKGETLAQYALSVLGNLDHFNSYTESKKKVSHEDEHYLPPIEKQKPSTIVHHTSNVGIPSTSAASTSSLTSV